LGIGTQRQQQACRLPHPRKKAGIFTPGKVTFRSSRKLTPFDPDWQRNRDWKKQRERQFKQTV